MSGAGERNFKLFFDGWLKEQEKDLSELASASRDSDEQENLRQLVNKVMENYDNYYKAKSSCAKDDATIMFSPTWTSSLENAFQWIGGWRPSMVFRLVYAKSGLLLETELSDLLQGLRSGSLADLSPEQLLKIDESHVKTIREEKELTEKLAKLQETIADTPMVELAHIATETKNSEELKEIVGYALDMKSKGLEEILRKADDLRLRTLKETVDILWPLQAVDFLIAAAELHLRVHEWGKRRANRRKEQH